MTLSLYFHPLASYCHKALIALYEHDVAFTPRVIDLFDPAQRAELTRLWPLAKFPVLHDAARDVVVAEASVVIEHLDVHYGRAARLIPADVDAALRCRQLDRVFDLHVNDPMSKIVTDTLRPEGQHDHEGVAQARASLATSYAYLETELRDRTWAMGDAFSLADCAAAPALFYANEVAPFAETHAVLGAYLGRLRGRPSFARVLEEMRPYWRMFPLASRDEP